MKKNRVLFEVVLVIISNLSIAQINLRNQATSPDENNQLIIRLSSNEKQSFNPTKAEASLGLDNNTSFDLLSKEDDAIGVYYRYQQKINNIPVENSMLIAHTQN